MPPSQLITLSNPRIKDTEPEPSKILQEELVDVDRCGSQMDNQKTSEKDNQEKAEQTVGQCKKNKVDLQSWKVREEENAANDRMVNQPTASMVDTEKTNGLGGDDHHGGSAGGQGRGNPEGAQFHGWGSYFSCGDCEQAARPAPVIRRDTTFRQAPAFVAAGIL